MDDETEKPIIDIKVRLAKLEEDHNSVTEIHEEWPILEARVTNIESCRTIVDDVQRRVDKIEANTEIITAKVSAIDDSAKKLTTDMSEFKDTMRCEFDRLLKWVTIIIAGSLVGGLATLYQHQGHMFKAMGIKIGSVEKASAKNCSEIEKDIIRMNVKIDTATRD